MNKSKIAKFVTEKCSLYLVHTEGRNRHLSPFGFLKKKNEEMKYANYHQLRLTNNFIYPEYSRPISNMVLKGLNEVFPLLVNALSPLLSESPDAAHVCTIN
jgi:hypothetical protein